MKMLLFIALIFSCSKNEYIPDCSLDPKELQQQLESEFGIEGLMYDCREGEWYIISYRDSLTNIFLPPPVF